MTFILFIGFIGLLIYIVKLNSRLTRLEKNIPLNVIDQSKAVAKSAGRNTTSAMTSQVATSTKAKPTLAKGVTTATSPQLDTHSFINFLPKIGIVALVIGLGFFMKYAIDEGWVSITTRLIMGGVIGTLFLTLFYFWRAKYPKYALVLAGGGLAIWFLTVWAAVQLYMVISSDTGLIILVVLSLAGVFLSYKTKSIGMALMSWGGAFLVPIILSIGMDQYSLLLIYLTVLSTATLLSMLSNRAFYLFPLALFGSLINILWVNLAQSISDQQYLHTLVFAILSLFIYSVALVFFVRKQTPDNQPEVNGHEYTLMAGLLYIVHLLPIVAISYLNYREFTPLILAGVGLWIFITYAMLDRLEHTKLNYIMSGFGSTMIGLALLWQFNPSDEIFAFYLLGLVGVIVGRIQNRAELRSWGLMLVMVGVSAAAFFSYGLGEKTLLVSEKFLLEISGIVALITSYLIIKREQLTLFEGSVHNVIQILSASLLWFFVSWDLIHYFNSFTEINQRNISLSAWWIVFALILIALSTIVTLKPLRKLGLILIGIVIIKVFIFDVQSLDTVYRIISFVSLGVILLMFSFIYQRNKQTIQEYLK